MTKRIGFIGNPMRLPQGSRDNTGNIVHGHAARSLFSDYINVQSDPADSNIAQIRETITHLGFVAATMMHVRKPPKYAAAHERAAEFIEKLDLPVCAFGFGCHAGLTDTVSDANVDPRTIRLLQAIAARSETVGVRGEFTADLCVKYGVKNVSVVGCQSAYIAAAQNRQGIRNIDFEKPPMATISLGPEERWVQLLIMRVGGDVVGQNDPTEERIATGGISKDEFLIEENELWLSPFIIKMIRDGVFTRSDYFDYTLKHFKKFYSVPAWRKYISDNYGFCFGTRFHGNMIALQSGVPSLWLIHDMRTRELCEHLNLPSAPIECVGAETSLESLHELVSYSRFWNYIPRRTREFMNYLSANGVSDLLDKGVVNSFDDLICKRF